MTAFNALVLAGSRGGRDPVADYAGVPHKALILLEGRTLLARVVDALRQAGAKRIGVSTNDPDVLAEVARLKQQQGAEAEALQLLRQSMALWFKPPPDESEGEEEGAGAEQVRQASCVFRERVRQGA